MNLQQERAGLAAQARENNKQHSILKWRRKHPDLDCEANLTVLISYLDGEEANESNLEDATALLLANDRLARLTPTRVQVNAEQQQAIAAQQAVRDRINLEATLIAETKESNRDHVRRSLKFETNEQLQFRLDQLRAKKKLKGMSVEELQAFLKNARQQPEIQPEIVNFTKEQIQKLSAQEYRALLFDRSGREKPGVRQQIENIMRGL